LRERRLNDIRRKRLNTGKGEGKGQIGSQIQEYIMGIWFNGFQTTGTLCKKKLIANIIFALYKHVARQEEFPGIIYYCSSKRIYGIQKRGKRGAEQTNT
jgi:hypothetical protein